MTCIMNGNALSIFNQSTLFHCLVTPWLDMLCKLGLELTHEQQDEILAKDSIKDCVWTNIIDQAIKGLIEALTVQGVTQVKNNMKHNKHKTQKHDCHGPYMVLPATTNLNSSDCQHVARQVKKRATNRTERPQNIHWNRELLPTPRHWTCLGNQRKPTIPSASQTKPTTEVSKRR